MTYQTKPRKPYFFYYQVQIQIGSRAVGKREMTDDGDDQESGDWQGGQAYWLLLFIFVYYIMYEFLRYVYVISWTFSQRLDVCACVSKCDGVMYG